MTCRWERQKYKFEVYSTYRYFNLLLNTNFGRTFYYEKIITISTLTAGIGVSSLGLNANHADAAEYNHNPAPQHNQFGQQGPHGQNMQFSHQQDKVINNLNLNNNLLTIIKALQLQQH